MLKKILAIAILIASFALPAKAQLTAVGVERPVSPSGGPFLTLAPPNTPVSSFAVGTGVNTFLLSVQPTVSIRVYITNNTAIACLGSFTVSMAVASDGQVSSFVNQINNWQSVGLQSATGGIVSTVAVDVPANGTSYVSSSAISGPTVAIMVVSNNPCAGTNVEATAVVSGVSITSPLTSFSAGSFSGGTLSNVQGIVPGGSNASPVLPVIVGSLGPATNQQTAALGVDTFQNFATTIPGNLSTFTVSVPAPTPSQPGEYAVNVIANDNAAVVLTLAAPYTCITAGNPCLTSNDPQFAAAPMAANSTNTMNHIYTTTSAGCSPGPCIEFGHTILYKNVPTTVRNGTAGNNVTTISTGSNTLAGSTIQVSVVCSTAACQIAPTDTQSLAFKNVTTTVQSTNTGTKAVTTWVAGPTTAAAETVTFNVVSGTIQGGAIVEFVGVAPALPNQPSVGFQSDSVKAVVTGGNIPGSTDPCLTIVLKSSTPINIVAAGTSQPAALNPQTGKSVYVCGGSFTIAPSGTTADTLSFEYGTGATCGTGTTLLTGAYGAGDLTTTTGVTPINLGSDGTDFSTPTGNGLCFVAAGTTVNIQGVLSFVIQ